MSELPSGDELRALVRAVLRDVLPDTPAVPGRTVDLRTDADLDTLVREVATQAGEPARRAELLAGRHGFRLAAAESTTAGTTEATDVIRVDSGAVTERTVRRAAAAGARLVVGRRAVLTPLARDRARALGVEVERERSE